MGRPGLSNHPKFRRLAFALGSAARARGHLELMWEVAYENGDPRLGDAVGVEAAAQWDGPRGDLFAALRDAGGPGRAGFIEAREGMWEVHDLYDHAPDYVRKRAKREAERRSTGRTLDAEVRSLTGQCPPNGGQRPENGTPPAPAPAPAPVLPPPAPPRGANVVPLHTQEAEEEVEHPFWEFSQAEREKLGRAREQKPEGFDAWARAAEGEVGPERLSVAYGRYLLDDHFRLKGWPMPVFQSPKVWRPRATRVRDTS